MPVAPKCPVCRRKESAASFAPFCSARCAQIDLGRWLSEDYKVNPAAGGDDDEAPDTADAGAGEAQ